MAAAASSLVKNSTKANPRWALPPCLRGKRTDLSSPYAANNSRISYDFTQKQQPKMTLNLLVGLEGHVLDHEFRALSLLGRASSLGGLGGLRLLAQLELYLMAIEKLPLINSA